jgi:Fe-S-cluster containining protein
MKLKVIENADSDQPWYSNGLRFTCTQCGNCCTGGPGYVWISVEEIVRLADHLKLTPEETVERYCRKINGQFSLKERRTREGLYDCIFLKEIEEPATQEQIASKRKACSIYTVRPLQCRTWPFWPENLEKPENWKQAGQRCHGMDNGTRSFSQRQIEAIRDSADWPKNPPTSAQLHENES